MTNPFGAGSSQQTSQAFALGADNLNLDQATIENQCLRLTSRFRCLDCRLGLEAYEDEFSAANSIDQLI